MIHKGNLARRLEESRQKAKQLEASHVIYKQVISWWKFKKGKKNILQILRELQKKKEAEAQPWCLQWLRARLAFLLLILSSVLYFCI